MTLPAETVYRWVRERRAEAPGPFDTLVEYVEGNR